MGSALLQVVGAVTSAASGGADLVGPYAYIDPGTGSFVIQIVLGALFAGLFMLKLWWNKVKAISARLMARRGSGKGHGP